MEQNSKCILLVRVSTEQQDFDEQEKELYQLALNEGYSDNNIIPICEKESGIKLSEEERSGLNRMKEIISSENITCVFAWEISRIARKKKIIFSITDYLVARGIQLIIKEPYVRLLNPDKTINEGAETILTLFSQIAESEMRNKMARWKRSKVANAKAGLWNGGKRPRFGYSLDENNRIIINEEEAKIIRLAYEIYLSDPNIGQTIVRNELLKRGYNVNKTTLTRFFTWEGYTGKLMSSPYYINKSKYTGREKRYPAIISEELFKKVQNKKEYANYTAYKGINYYFAKTLITCPYCNHLYISNKNLGLYKCECKTIKNKTNVAVAININILDTILWDATVDEYMIARSKTLSDNKEDYLKQIDICDEIILSTENKIEKCNTKKKRFAMIFANGDIEEEDYQKSRDKIEDEISQIKQDCLSAQERKKQLTKLINNSDSKSFVDILKSLSDEVYSYNELKEMSELVHTFIEKVELSRNSDKGYNTKYIRITAYSGNVYEYLSRYTNGGYKIFLYWKKHKQLSSAFDEWVQINPELIINRSLGKKESNHLIIKSDKPYYPNGR